MINKRSISKEQALYAIENREFSEDIISSKDIVVVIMTQDWCPQWHDIRSWAYDINTQAEVDIYDLVYNKTEFAREFMQFKESQWGNYQVPYLRYYKGGKLFKETNYISSTQFKRLIQTTH